MRIELCGGIASGKSTFASVAQNYLANSIAVYEQISDNCFLTDFYLDPKYYAFETEIAFLLQHMHQIKVAQKTSNVLICDYSLEQDYAYGESNLVGGALNAFYQTYQEAINQIHPADLILFFDCPINVLLKRIKTRNRGNERGIDSEYLSHTINCLKQRLESVACPVVVIDSEKYDFRNNSVFLNIWSNVMEKSENIFELR